MKRWKTWQIILFVALCALLNFGGRFAAGRLDLPLWLDSFGTVFCAYIGGPMCGSMVGVTGNLIYNMIFKNPYSYVYSLTSVALGIIVGLSARKDRLSTLFGAMTVGSIAAIAATMISAPLNLIFYDGSTGNLWGNGAIGFFREHGFPHLLCAFLGDFYIEFPDKMLTVLVLALVLWIIRRIRPGKSAVAAALVAVLLPLSLLSMTPRRASAEAEAAAEARESAHYSNYVQTVYSSHNGLPCGEANDIAQTDNGIMWIGTYAGLYRYNGKEFRRMDYDSVHNVNCLYVDSEGRLWIGTNDSGLSIAIDEQVVNVVDQAKGLPADSVRSIIQSSDGYYYIGTTGSLQVLTLNSGLKRVSTLWEVNHAEDLAADRHGHVAGVTSDGRLFLMEKGRIRSSLRLTNGKEIFKSCAFNAQGRLMVGTSTNNLYIYEVDSGSFKQVGRRILTDMTSVNAVNVLGNGEVFISADNGVGYLGVDGKYHRINTNEFNDSIDNMLMDYQDNLWFTSSRLGLLRLAPSSFRDVYSTIGMENRVVNAIVHWQGSYYFGTDRGLDAVDEACGARVENALTERLAGVRIRCLLVDDAGSLWICTYRNGLIEVEPDGTQHVYDDDGDGVGKRARVAIQLSDGTVVAGGNTGLSFIRDHQVVNTVGKGDGLENPIILTLTEMADGALMVGTDGGGIAIVEDGQVVKSLNIKDGLSSRVILRTVRDPKSAGVFIVTSNSLCYMESDGSIRELEHFPYFNNYNLWAKDEDTLFVLSSAGIYVVNRDELLADQEGMTYDLLDARRGLNSALTANAFSWYDGQGNLFLPCDRGVFILDTQSYDTGASHYRLMVSSVRLDDEMVRVDRSTPILVNRDVGTIILYPEIINYTVQDPNVGFYLEGFDRDWITMAQSSLSTAVYTNLPVGEYTFHLAVFDNRRETILEERDYTLIKRQEIYDYRWFGIYIVLIPLVAVAWLSWFVVKVRMQRTLEIQERELEVARQQIQMGNETIIAIAKAVDAKDERTSQHSLRVSEYSVMIARELGFGEQDCENLRKAALMHDIGKIGIPDNILNKPARLTDEEYAVMKSHVTRGADILKDFTLIDHVVDGALHHHERYDGRGYPSGMKGEQIPLYGRIIGVADAFDAMTANRVYRKQMDFDYVLGEMQKGRGTQFDPQIVDILLKLIDDGKIDLNALYGVPVQKPAEKEGRA